jgi:hypothetical protein
MATISPTVRVVDADGAPVTGDAGNLTLALITDGVAAAYGGSISEVTGGEYAVTVTVAGTLQAIVGISSTSGAVVIPARWRNGALAGDSMAATAASVQAGLTAQGYTEARAPKLDSLLDAGSVADEATMLFIKAQTDLITSDPATATAVAAIASTLAGIKGDGWTSQTLVALAAAIAGITPSDPEAIAAAVVAALTMPGPNALTGTLVDGDGAPVANQTARIRNADDDGTVIGWAMTDASGVLRCLGAGLPGLADGDYAAAFLENPGYSFDNLYPFTVDGPTAVEFVCTAVALPAAPDPAYCAVYAEQLVAVKDPTDTTIPADVFACIAVVSVPAGYATSVAVMGDPSVNPDSHGRATLYILKGAVAKLKYVPVRGAAEFRTVTAPDEDAANWRDL